MYQAINEIMEQLNAGMGASETHGMATGMLVVENRMDANNWLKELNGHNASISASAEMRLREWFEQIRQQLVDADDEFSFQLFLPDEDEPLTEQAEAIRTWCMGFLFGIGYEHSDSNWPGETAEIIRDLIEITKMDTNIHDEEDADALIEIHEYLRAAVFIVRDHFLNAGNGNSH
jgi:yecA family protein